MRMVVIFSVLLGAFGLYALKELRFSFKTDDLIDVSLREQFKYDSFKNEFPEKTQSILLLELPDTRAAALCDLQNQLLELGRKNAFLYDISSLFDVRKIDYTRDNQGEKYHYMRILDACKGQTFEQLPPNPYTNIFYNDKKLLAVTFFYQDDASPDLEFPKLKQLVDERLPGKKHWVGEGSFQHYNRLGLIHTQYLNLFALFVIILCMRWFYGSWQAGILFSATFIYTMVLVFAVMALSKTAIDPLNSSITLMCLIASLEDFVFISHHMGRTRQNCQASTRRLFAPGFFTSLTTVIGFASLLLSPLSAIKAFGFFTALSAIIEWLVMFYMLPAFCRIFPTLDHWAQKTLAPQRWIERFSLPRWASIALLAFFPLAMFLFPKLNFNFSAYHLLPPAHPFQQSVKTLETHFGWQGEVSLLLEQGDENLNRQRLEVLSQNPIIHKLQSPYGLMDFLGEMAPLQSTLIKREVLLSDFGKRLFGLEHDRALIFLKKADSKNIIELEKNVADLCPDKQCTLSGNLMLLSHYADSIIRTLRDGLATSILLVVIVLFFLARNLPFKERIMIILSSLWAQAFMLVQVVLFQIEINIVTCVVATTLVGLTGDNAIQFLRRGQQSIHDNIDEITGASLEATLLMGLVSFCLVFSYFEQVRNLGILMGLGIFSSVVGDIAIVRGLLPGKKAGV